MVSINLKLLVVVMTLVCVGTLFTACQKEQAKDNTSFLELSESTYLIFGRFNGECFGELCVESFKLTDSMLLEDTLDIYMATNFAFVPLADSLYEQVADIIDFFPEALLSDSNTTFGCPDCLDQGGIMVQLVIDNDLIGHWRIDRIKTEVPTYLHDFVDEIELKIELINN